MNDQAGDPKAISIWDTRTGTFLRRIDAPLVRITSVHVSFVAGTHELLVSLPEGVGLVDADSGRSRVILKMAQPFGIRISGDGRTLLVEKPGVEADLWLMEFKK